MKMSTWMTTQNNGVVSMICGGIFESREAAEDDLFDKFDYAYNLKWINGHYESYDRTSLPKHRFNAYILDFVVVDR